MTSLPRRVSSHLFERGSHEILFRIQGNSENGDQAFLRLPEEGALHEEVRRQVRQIHEGEGITTMAKKMSSSFSHGAPKGGMTTHRGSAKKQGLIATPSNMKSLGGKAGK